MNYRDQTSITTPRKVRQPVGRGKKITKKKEEIRAWLISEKGWTPDKFGHLLRTFNGVRCRMAFRKTALRFETRGVSGAWERSASGYFSNLSIVDNKLVGLAR
jgi:hypothetical protein